MEDIEKQLRSINLPDIDAPIFRKALRQYLIKRFFPTAITKYYKSFLCSNGKYVIEEQSEFEFNKLECCDTTT